MKEYESYGNTPHTAAENKNSGSIGLGIAIALATLIVTIIAVHAVYFDPQADMPLPDKESMPCFVLAIASMVGGGLLGICGLSMARKGRFYLHNGTGDILLGIPLGILHWGSLVAMALYPLYASSFPELYNGALLTLPAIWVITLALSVWRVIQCNDELSKCELVAATCGRLFVETAVQVLSISALVSLNVLRQKLRESGSTAKVHATKPWEDMLPVSLRNRYKKDMRLLLYVCVIMVCAYLGKKFYDMMAKTSRNDTSMGAFVYGVLTAAAGLLIYCFATTQQHSHDAALKAEPADTPQQIATPTEANAAPTEAAPEPVQSLVEQTAPDTPPAPVQQQILTLGNTKEEHLVSVLAYGLSPENIVRAELVPLKNGQYLCEEARQGNMVTVSVWVKLSIDMATYNNVAPVLRLFLSAGASEKVITQRPATVITEDTEDETMCRDAGNIDASHYPDVIRVDTDNMLESIRSDSNLIFVSGGPGEDVTGYAIEDEKSSAYVLYKMIKHLCGEHNIYPFCVTVQLMNQDNQALANLKREEINHVNYGQAVYNTIYSNVVEKEMLLIDPGFYGGSAVGYGESGDLIFKTRIMKITGTIPAQVYKQISSCSIKIASPSFKLNADDLKMFAKQFAEAEKHDKEKKEASATQEPVKMMYEFPGAEPQKDEPQPKEVTEIAEPLANTELSASNVLSEAEKAEIEDFLETLVMVSSRASSTTRLYQTRLMTLLPMIQEGAPVDVTTPETKGNTALHYACGMSRVDIVEWLLRHGADVNKLTDKGKSPLDCVSGYNAAEIRNLLIQKGARKGKP